MLREGLAGDERVFRKGSRAECKCLKALLPLMLSGRGRPRREADARILHQRQRYDVL